MMGINTISQAREAARIVEKQIKDFPSVISLLEASEKRTPDAIALTYLDASRDFAMHTRWTYTQLLSRIRGAGTLFAELSGDEMPVVSIALPSVPEHHVALWGAQVSGIGNPLNPWLEEEFLVQLMKAAGTTVLVTQSVATGGATARKAISAAFAVPSIRAICLVGEEAGEQSGIPERVKVIQFDQDRLGDHSTTAAQAGRPEGKQVAAYFHTGGTTSAPKLAMLSHESLVSAALAANLHLGLAQEDVALGGLPLFHINGISVTGLWPWAVGAQVVMLGALGFREPALLNRFWNLAKTYGGTYLSGVPTVYQALLGAGVDVADQARQTRLKFGVVGAAPLPPELRLRFESLCGIPLIEGYGLTESACVATVAPRDGSGPASSVGMALAGLAVRAVHIDQHSRRIIGDAPPDSVGTIVLQGANVFRGYVEPDHDAQAWVTDETGRWFDTGDLGSVDVNGFWRLAGRAKDLIIRGGHNIDPTAIESSLARHPKVAQVAAVGRPDRKLGEVPAAYVQLLPGASVSVQELQTFAEESISERAAVPRHIEIVEALPLTAVGKIFKPALICRQIEQVFNQEIAASGYQGRHTIAARLDKSAGYAVGIDLLDPVSLEVLDALRAQLGMYAFKVELTEPLRR